MPKYINPAPARNVIIEVIVTTDDGKELVELEYRNHSLDAAIIAARAAYPDGRIVGMSEIE